MKLVLQAVVYCFALLMLASSCQDKYTICDKATDVSLKAGLYHVAGGTESAANAPSFSLSLINSPTFLYNQQADISKFSVALNAALDSSQYLVKLSSTSSSDTLTVVYTSQSVNISAECGFVYTNNLLRVCSTNNTIDSVKIINPANNTTSGENVKVYF